MEKCLKTNIAHLSKTHNLYHLPIFCAWSRFGKKSSRTPRKAKRYIYTDVDKS